MICTIITRLVLLSQYCPTRVSPISTNGTSSEMTDKKKTTVYVVTITQAFPSDYGPPSIRKIIKADLDGDLAAPVHATLIDRQMTATVLSYKTLDPYVLMKALKAQSSDNRLIFCVTKAGYHELEKFHQVKQERKRQTSPQRDASPTRQ